MKNQKSRTNVARTALSLGLSWLLVWGGVPAPALAAVVEEQPSVDQSVVEVSSDDQQNSDDQQDVLGITVLDDTSSNPIVNEVDEDDGDGEEPIIEPMSGGYGQGVIDEGNEAPVMGISNEEPLSELVKVEEVEAPEVVTNESVALATQSEAALEASEPLKTSISGSAVSGTSESPYGLTNEQLVNGYLQELIDESLPGSHVGLRTQSASSNFTGNMGKVYEYLKTEIKKVAAGTRSDTVFTIDLDMLGTPHSWTASQLGVSNFSTNTNINNAYKAALNKLGIDKDKLISALIADCPYDLYWYGARNVYQAFGCHVIEGPKLELTDPMTFTLHVANSYQDGDDTHVKSGSLAAAKTALQNAQSIVSKHKDEGTMQMLKSFSDEICKWVDYDFATPRNSAYGNPWQLVNVFDGNTSTKVLCEGYAKAFKYLCDYANKPGVECLTVTGTMHGGTGAGAHMWNVVRLNNAKSYVVDVTNCDDGTIGQPAKEGENPFLFMRCYQSGSYADGFSFNAGGKTIKYTYDAATKNLNGQTVLSIVKGTQISSKTATVAAKTYTGSSQANGITVKGLTEGEDYTIKWPSGCIKAGTYTATLTGLGNYVGTKSVQFTIKKDKPVINIASTSVTKTYGDAAFSVNATKTKGDDKIKYKSSNTSVASVNSSGKITLKSSGTTTITAYMNANTNFEAASKTMKLTVKKAKNPLTLKVKKAVKSVKYKPTTKVSTGANVKKSKAQGTVTFANSSSDTTAKNFTINKSTGAITLPANTQGGKYTVKITATALGNAKYEKGTASATYTIEVKPITSKLKVKAKTQNFRESDLASGAETVTPLTVTNPANNTKYEKVSGKSNLTLNTKTGAVTIAKGTKKGTYTMRVKVKAPATNNYKEKTKTVTVRVKVKKG